MRIMWVYGRGDVSRKVSMDLDVHGHIHGCKAQSSAVCEHVNIVNVISALFYILLLYTHYTYPSFQNIGKQMFTTFTNWVSC